MKAEELRIGNYVKIDEGIGKVAFIMDKNFVMNMLMMITI